jgi:purine-binding chemotaxis protein CheW
MNYEDIETPEIQDVSYLKFSLHDEAYAIPLLSVKEVIAMPEVTAIPNTPKHFLGIMNLRGQIISIIDLRSKLAIKDEFDAETTVIICEVKPFCVGIVVNSVDSVLTVSSDEIKSKPEIESVKSTDYITGVINRENNLILLLDIIKAIDVNDHSVIVKNEKKAA